MSYRGGIITGVVGTLLLVGAAGGAWWLLGWKPGEATKPSPPPVPATVPKSFKEDQAAAVTLTAEAEKALALRVGEIVKKPMLRRRTYGGEVVITPGYSVVVSAPLAGTLEAVDPARTAAMAVAGPFAATLPPSPDIVPVAGRFVAKGQAVLQLVPILDPIGSANLAASRVDAEGQVQSAAEQLKAADIALARAKEVLAGGAGSQRQVDEAQAQEDVAKKLLEAATARRNTLARLLGELESGGATPIRIESPENGILRTVSALPGQAVPSGAALFEVINLDKVWVRVPVYVGELPDIDATRPANVGSLAEAAGGLTRTAAPVTAPPAANPVAGTLDLFFALDNRRCVQLGSVAGCAAFVSSERDALYGPGERVGVSLALKGPAESLTVPWKAVVYDYHGGAWVYEKTGDRSYTRRRVAVRYVSEGTAVLAEGPHAGTRVVTDGAAELFGTETGFSK